MVGRNFEKNKSVKSENIKVATKDKEKCAMLYNLPSFFTAFSLFLVKVWTMTAPREAGKLGSTPLPYCAPSPTMMSHKINHMPGPATHPGHVLPTVGAFQLEVQPSLESPSAF